ncbi:MAG: outer membrane beta-barrel protein [Burkholderiales bacterium]
MGKGACARIGRAGCAAAIAIGISFGSHPAFAQLKSPPATEREFDLSGGRVPDGTSLSMPEGGPTRVTGFVVGSFSYNSRVQMVPEFAGGGPALADPQATNFRFDKFGLGFSKSFAPWLSGAVAVEVENHRDRHSHGFDPVFGCPGTGSCIERFGAEEPETEASLDKFNLTGIVPVGNGLSLSIGRFDVPFGIERHDEPLNLTATPSEVFRFGRPQQMTGFQTSYQIAPSLEVAAWAVNRAESETTHTPFDDNNKHKSYGGRIGFTPFPRGTLLAFGLGGFWGPEQDNNDSSQRRVLDLDFSWTPYPEVLLTGEVVQGSEDKVSFRERGIPFAAPAVADQDVKWRGFYVLSHYDVRPWMGLSVRYGRLNDLHGARTGVAQVLQSLTIAPIIHLSRLIPELRSSGATYARTRHPNDWVDLKLEYRYNFSNQPVFSKAAPATDILNADTSSHQVQIQAVVNF